MPRVARQSCPLPVGAEATAAGRLAGSGGWSQAAHARQSQGPEVVGAAGVMDAHFACADGDAPSSARPSGSQPSRAAMAGRPGVKDGRKIVSESVGEHEHGLHARASGAGRGVASDEELRRDVALRRIRQKHHDRPAAHLRTPGDRARGVQCRAARCACQDAFVPGEEPRVRTERRPLAEWGPRRPARRVRGSSGLGPVLVQQWGQLAVERFVRAGQARPHRSQGDPQRLRQLLVGEVLDVA